MTAKIQQAEGMIVIVGALLVGYALFKSYKGVADIGGKAVDAVSGLHDKAVAATVAGMEAITNTASSVVDTVTGAGATAAKAVSEAAQNAYGETKAFLTGFQYYSPSAIDANLSGTDARNLARQIDNRIDAINLADEQRQYSNDRLQEISPYLP